MGGEKHTHNKTSSASSRNYLMTILSFISFAGIGAYLIDKYYFDAQFSSWTSLLLGMSTIISFDAFLLSIMGKKATVTITSDPQLEHYSSEILESINEGVLLLNPQGEIKLANPSVKSLVGWGNSETEKINYESFIKFINREDLKILIHS